MIRLYLCDNAELAEPSEIIGLDNLCMDHAEPSVSRTVDTNRHLEHVEQRIDREITNCMNLRC